MYIDDPVKQLKKIRDLTVMRINEKQFLVVACDSDGGIGNKPHDAVRVPEDVLGQFAVRVPLFEIISCGARPFLVIDCLSIEMEPSGAKILHEIRRYVNEEAGFAGKVQFTGSSEENVPTVQTGVGITVLGMADREGFTAGTSRAGDQVLCIGIPKSGPDHEIRPEDPDLISVKELITLRNQSFVRDILPVGSQGILREADQLAESSGCSFQAFGHSDVDLHRSAGPATSVLLTTDKNRIHEISRLVSAPVTAVGALV